ncbi:ABC transporter permease subunit [Saccharopolyspora indica]|uniref:D-methionine transport system permease protein n=2 Tax=Saccharopolyspora TaxID=1835 RepID=A0A1I5EU69_9PSEU|nr:MULTISPECIES: ABC transporter permease subunit [Saccharopolyspora]MDA3648033.1 ABC transporter permease subunit [Saccharopolyspora indica]RKT83544.1 D-methionine transport system permease protein [Saccharopolyspora antimicrobica]SEG79900.1 D-methionine transport system permease protein [Saccharopolyspora kobensis]SFD09812.1 D-methionine transport system permease protein [Saccharopolyspora kobensis]SFO14926.1 D-methionine transport system permease protein [Saccharopolyspora antimicrobica]
MSDVTPWSEVFATLGEATLGTLYMVLVSTLLAVLGGLPLGVLLHLSSPVGLNPKPVLYRVLGVVVDVVRSVPFVVLLVVLASFTRLLIGTSIGSTAVIVPLTIGAIPFFARLTQNALREVSFTVVEAAITTGSSRLRIVWTVLLGEARAALVGAVGVTAVALIGYAAMAGAIGGGGLGTTAIQDGYQGYDDRLLYGSVVVLAVLAFGMQLITDLTAKLVDRRRTAAG